ncbi:MAG: hypothetical protein IKF58_15115 [Bacillus sp. (in: Bacteria)]|nr:hypothetical protein [Bacillus sp. (in: firmicutes)]
MKDKLRDVPVVLIMMLGLGAAVLFCLGMTIEAAACGVIALIIALVGLK